MIRRAARWAAAAWAALALAGPAAAGPVVLGPVSVTVDESVFAVVGSQNGRLTLECRAADCSRFGREPPAVFVAIAPASAPSPCGARNSEDDWGRDVERGSAASGDVTFDLVRRRSMCRALSPDLQQACGRVGDHVVFVFNGSGTGCRSASELVPHRFRELVEGLRPKLRGP